MHEESIRWPDGNIMALSVVVNVEEGSEMTVARGDRGMEPVDELGIHIRSPIRNYGNESNYLYGIKAGAPRIVRLLKAYDIMASWTVAALSLENYPEIAAAIAELGHEPVSHGWRWVHQFKMNEEQEREFIRKAVESIERTVGVRPYGWLSRYFHTDATRRLLIEEAAGIAKYKARKKESLRKMEAAQANLSRLTDIIQEIERSLSSLERQAQKAQQAKRIKGELLEKEMTWGRRKMRVLTQKLETLRAQKESLEHELISLRAELSTIEAAVEAELVEVVEEDAADTARLVAVLEEDDLKLVRCLRIRVVHIVRIQAPRDVGVGLHRA